MMPLLPEQVESLRQLQELCRGFGADVVIIGAIAYRVWVDDPQRQTEDLDLAVALDFPEFEALTHALSDLGWRQDARREQRWHSPQGGRLDLLPAGERLRKQGWVEWPRSGMRMSLVGFASVFASSPERVIAPGLVAKVVGLPLFALLKIVAFLDDPHSRQKDVQDLVALMHWYAVDGDRRFRPEVYDAGIEYEHAGAFLLGQDVAGFCGVEEMALVESFVRWAKSDPGAHSTVLARWSGETGGEPSRLIGAFEMGLRS